jgi:hypothetical protein
MLNVELILIMCRFIYYCSLRGRDLIGVLLDISALRRSKIDCPMYKISTVIQRPRKPRSKSMYDIFWN